MSLIDKTAISQAAKHRLKLIIKARKRKPRPTYEEIGIEFGICKQRVHQILKKAEK